MTRKNVGTASLLVRFLKPTRRFFFWERGSTTSPTTANSDLLVEALDWRGRVTASYKLLRSDTLHRDRRHHLERLLLEPKHPGRHAPELGSVGLELDYPTTTLRLTSVQEEPGGVRDDGPDYKVIAEASRHRHSHWAR